jgi:Tol biopolymer transport system component
MPFSRTFRRTLTSVVLLGLTASCSSDSDSLTGPSPVPEPVIIKDAAVVVDSTALVLLSDSLERVSGTYRFRVVGNSAPTLEAGNVIVGAQGPGFLRRITSVSTAGDVITLGTAQAALTDVLERGSFQTTVQLTTPAGSPRAVSGGSADVRYSPLQADYLADGVTLAAGALSLKDTDLCKELLNGNCPDWVKLTIPEGSITFEPGLDIDGSIKNGAIETFHTIATGALSLDLSVKAVATKEFTTEGDKKLAEISKRFAALVAGVPVVGKATISYTVGYKATANLETSYETGATVTTQVAAGARYAAATGWTGVWDTSLQTQQKTTEWEAQAQGDVRIFIRPELKLIFYEVAGPFIQVEPWLKGEAFVGTQQCELKVSAGIDSKIGFKIEILGAQVRDYDEDFPGTPLSIFDYPCPIGTLKVTNSTTGTNPDPDGYTVTLDGGDSKSMSPNGEVTYVFLPEQTFSVRLDGVANNCTVGGQNPRPATILAGDTTTANFNVACTEDTGTLQVTASTTGSPADPDGYTVVVDGTQTLPVGTNGTVSFADMSVGTHSVSLEGIAENCAVGGQNPVSVNVALGATVPVSFPVSCGSTQQITVNTQTTGSPIDPDGYTVSLDGDSPESIAINGTWLFSDVAVGSHSLRLDDLEGNCTVQGTNPQTVNVTAGVDATATFNVDCTNGALTVQASTSGPAEDIDPNGYTVTVDGTVIKQLDVNGSVSFPGLATGSHSVELSGVDDPCIITSFNPQTVDVPGTITFIVNCGVSGQIALGGSLSLRVMKEDGTDVTTIYQSSSGSNNWPSWSPDGSRIAFQRNANGLYAVDADGSNLVQLTTDNDHRQPDWSPNGNQIAFRATARDTSGSPLSYEIYSIPAGGGDTTRISSLSDSVESWHPSWSPDGSKLAHVGLDMTTSNKQDLYVVSVSGGTPTRLTNVTPNSAAVYSPSWSPDGNQIAYIMEFGGTTRRRELRLIAPGGGSSTTILSIDLDPGVGSFNDKITWSPDSSRIMFYGTIASQAGLYTINADGTDLTLVTAVTHGQPDWSP